MMKRALTNLDLYRRLLVLPVLGLLLFAGVASAQGRGGSAAGRIGSDMVNLRVSEITLESVDFRDQTARLSLGIDATTPLPVSLKDFDYRLRLNDQETIEGTHAGTLKIGGRRGSRVDLPVVVNLRSIPSVIWNAFSNRGQVRYQLDTAFTLPLLIFEKRFDKSFDGEVPLRSLVDAATILRARNVGAGRGNVGNGGNGGSGWGDILGGILRRP